MSNIIAKGSNGVQAGRDLTVNQTINELPNSIQDMFIELLGPSIKQLGENLKGSISKGMGDAIGVRIKNALEESILKSLKEQVKIENLNYHIQMVIKMIHDADKKHTHSSESLNETFKKTDLFLEWIETAEDVSPEDKILSQMWQGWLYKLTQGYKNSEQKVLLDKMKLLTHDDAYLLLRYSDLRNSPLVVVKGGGQILKNDKSNYLIKRLQDLDLLKRTYSLDIFLLVFIVIFYSVLTFLGVSPSMLIPALIVLPLVVYFFNPSYRLTWLGKRIVSFAKPNDYNPTEESVDLGSN